jgi:ABC-type branched-subunit amino acid transport system substrate-binding protein
METAGGSTEGTADPPADDDGGGDGDWGDLEAVCGPAEGDGPAPIGDDPAETQGLSEDSIKVGAVADPGAEARPGLNQELFDAAEAFAAWCNDAGGINGRQVDLTLYDSALSNYQPRVEEACEVEFAMVGSGAIQDNLWPTIGAPCDLIDFPAVSINPNKSGFAGEAGEARVVHAIPNPADRQTVAAAAVLQEEFPEAPAASSMLWADLQVSIDQAEKQAGALETLGNEFVHDATYNVLGEASWTPLATSIEQAGVTWLRMVGVPEHVALLQQSFDEIGYQPDVTALNPNVYDPSYLSAAAGSAEGTFIETTFRPFEEADDNPATRQYIDQVEANGGKVALLGAQAISSWLLFATSARDCDREGDLSRSCLLEKGTQVAEWTGGGLHAPTSPAENEGSPCTIVLRVEGDEFVRHAPLDEDYACDPDWIVDMGEAGEG